MKAKPAWWKNPQTVVSCLVGCGAIGSWIVGSFVADARQQDDIRDVEEQVEGLEKQVSEQEQELDQNQVQYQLIQQSLGGIQETLKELKQKR